MHRGLYWHTSEGMQLDAGAFLAGLDGQDWVTGTGGCGGALRR